jgi:tetratricopeptide (TPR) repeat protein
MRPDSQSRRSRQGAGAPSTATAVTFRKIHTLLRAKRYRAVRKAILDDKTGRVVPPYTEDLNHTWYVIGNAELGAKRYDRALKAYQRSYRHDDGEGWMALMAIGNCYYQMKRPRMALRYYARALRFVPSNAELRYNLANMYIDLRQYSNAISRLRRISTRDVELRRKIRKNLQLARRMAGEAD